MIDTAANCADPANTITDMTIAPTAEKPTCRASTPNDSDSTSETIANGTPARTPARKDSRGERSSGSGVSGIPLRVPKSPAQTLGRRSATGLCPTTSRYAAAIRVSPSPVSSSSIHARSSRTQVVVELRVGQPVRRRQRAVVLLVVREHRVARLEDEVDRAGLDGEHELAAEDPAHVAVGPPLDGVDRAARLLLLEAAQQRREPRREAAGAPVRHHDLAAGLADADELVGCLVVLGDERRPERRQHAVEAVVLVGQRLGVALDPVDLDPGLAGTAARGFEQLGGDVEADDVGARRRGADRALPVPVATSSTRMPAAIETAPATAAPTSHVSSAIAS